MIHNPPRLSAPRGEAARRRAASPQPVINRMFTRVLQSPLSGAVDGSLVLLTVPGRRTGQAATLPVQYAASRDAIWVWPGKPETKTWWRNLRTETAVGLRLRGVDIAGTARVVGRSAEPALFSAGQQAYAARFPHASAATARAGAAVLVRIEVAPDVLASACRATVVPGSGLAAAVRRHPLGSYFLLTYLLSWSYWIPDALSGGHLSHFPGLLGPMTAAFIVTAVAAGRAGLTDLMRRMARWRVPLRWYAASLVPLAAALVALAALWLAGHGLPSLAQLSEMPGLPAVSWFGVLALALLVNGYGEETGWRGFAWPRLRQRHTLGGAALILSVPWALWHTPTFWIDSGYRGFPVFMIPGLLVGLAAGAVVAGWLYEHARSSILVLALWHASLNMVSATKGAEGLVQAVVSATIIGWAVLILRADHANRHAGRSARPMAA